MSGPRIPAVSIRADQGAALVALARFVVAAHMLGRSFAPSEPADPDLRADGACFVTLERHGALRGCIGMLQPVRPLYLDVAHNAVRAMHDPRLPPVTADEWTELDITVSVLSSVVDMPEIGVAAIRAALRPGEDGLILTDGMCRATFLPAVWRKLPTPEAFLAALVAKGGWSADQATTLTAQRYVAREFTDAQPRPALDAMVAPPEWDD